MIYFSQDGYMNITNMCGGFGKRPNDFLSLDSTKAFISALEADIKTTAWAGSLPLQPFFTAEGRNGGTWAHPDLAVECARWIQPSFAIWTNRKIREILGREKSALPTPAASALKPEPIQLGDTIERMTIAEWVRQYGLRKPDFVLFANQVRSFSVALGQPPSYQVDHFGVSRSFTLDLLQYVWDEYQSERRRKSQQTHKRKHWR